VTDLSSFDSQLERIIANQHHVINRLETDLASATGNLARVEKEIAKFSMLLMGVDGQNGLRGKILKIEADVQVINRWIWLASGVILAAQALVMFLR